MTADTAIGNPLAAVSGGEATTDRIRHVKLSTLTLPLDTPISDAKVLTGRQKPMTEIVLLFAEITTEAGYGGIGFSYSKRAGGPAQYAHAKEVADGLLGEDPNDIGRVYQKLLWAGASVGRSGVATQAIAALDIALYDLKAKRANLPLSKLLGAYRDSVQAYNTSGGFLHAPIEEVKERASQSLADGIGGIKIKVGQPDSRIDVQRLSAVREHIGDDVPLMVDANHNGIDPPLCASAESSNSSTWSGSKSRWTRTTPKATPSWPTPSTHPSPPARCSPASPNTSV